MELVSRGGVRASASGSSGSGRGRCCAVTCIGGGSVGRGMRWTTEIILTAGACLM